MPYKILEDQTKRLSASEAVVVLEGDSYEDLTSYQTKHDVLAHAGKLGMGVCGFSKLASPYVVTADGKPVETEEDMLRYRQDQLLYGNQKSTKFRIDYEVKSSAFGR